MLLKTEKKLKLSSQSLLLFLIVIFGLSLRLYKMDKMAPFDFDQEYAANFAYSVINVFPVQLIGQGLSVQGLFIGPLYFYFLVPFYAIFSLHPIGGLVGSVVLGLITVYAYYWIGSRFFGKTTGLVLAFWRATFFYKLQADWGITPAMASELLVIISWYCLWKLWQKQSRYMPLLALCFGLYSSIHPILFPFYFVFLALLVIRKSIPGLKILLISFAAFIVPLAPLIIFECFHNFLEVKRLFSLGGTGGEKAGLVRFLSNVLVNLKEPNLVFGLGLKLNWLPFILLVVIYVVLIIRRVDFWKDSFHQIMLPVTFVIFVVYYTLLPTHVPEYYFLAVSVLVFFYMGATVSLLVKKKILIPVFLIIIIYLALVNFRELVRGWNYSSPSALYNKEQIVKRIKSEQSDNGEFFVSYIKEPGWNFGFDYLFKYYGTKPQTREAVKPIYTIVIPRSLSPGNLDFTSGNIGLIIEK